jgi:uncharacterized membrane protein YccC
MTPEERFERIEQTMTRIAERQEALAQTVEIIAGMQRVNEERFARSDERLAQLMDTMNRLANIVVAHEQRLDDLENR